MSKQTINIGASPNDGTGTPLRTSFDYTNQNFTEIYTALGGGVALPGATTQVIFNDGGTNLAGDAGLVYNKTTDALTVAGLVTAGSATITGDLTVDTSTLKVDSTNNRVGIGTATPGETLDVKGTGNFNNTSGTYLGFQTNAAQVGYIGTANTILTGGLNTELGLWANSSLVIATGASALQRLRVEAAGDVTVSTGNVVMATSGKGIDFSATANSSGTMTSELLNDYEEGTWTPVVADASTGGNVGTCTINSATYTKIGRQVSIQCDLRSITTTGMTGGNNLFIRGLPFASVKGGNGSFYTYRVGRNASTVSSAVTVEHGVSHAFLSLFTTSSANTNLSILVSDITSGTSELALSVTYTV